MKRIHDIKRRTKRSTQEEGSLSWSESFWFGHKISTGKKDQQKKKNSAFYRNLALLLTVAALMMLAAGRAMVVKAELSKRMDLAKKHLNNSLALINQGKYDDALDESIKAKYEVDKVKLNLQAWGQDSQYLRVIDYRSDFVAAENLISSIDEVLDISTSTKSMIEDISSKLSQQKMSENSDINFHFDIDSLDGYLSNQSMRLADITESLGQKKTSGGIVAVDDQEKILQSFQVLNRAFTEVRENSIPLLKWFLGSDKERKIMLLLQNNAELRGSGGFIGSYAILTVKDSSITRVEFQTNIYKLDTAAAKTLDIPAPPEYDILSDGKMFLRDANYAVDSPESFAKVAELYQLESGQTLDGIVAVDTTLVTSLLQRVGQVDFPQYGLSINADNFLTEVQAEVERTYFIRDGALKENEPKKILAEMMPVILNRTFAKLKDSSSRADILDLFRQLGQAKHLQFFSKDEKIQAILIKYNLSGKLANGDFDYFLSHSTNIGGGKSSLNVSENVKDVVTLNEDGSVEHLVTIKRQHHGNGEWPDYDNVNLMRILLPIGSEVEDFQPAKGNFWPHMDKKNSKQVNHYLGDEGGKEKLSFWMNTLAQSESEVTFRYRSSYKIESANNQRVYKLLLQKQPGSNNNSYQVVIKYPTKWNFVANYLHQDLQYDLSLDKDKLLQWDFVL